MTLERYGQMCSMSILGHGEKEERENPKLETFDESFVCVRVWRKTGLYVPHRMLFVWN